MKRQCLVDVTFDLLGYDIVHFGLLPSTWMDALSSKEILVKSITRLFVTVIIINYFNFNGIMSNLLPNLLH